MLLRSESAAKKKLSSAIWFSQKGEPQIAILTLFDIWKDFDHFFEIQNFWGSDFSKILKNWLN